MSKKFEVQALPCPQCGSPVNFKEDSICPSCKHTLVVQPPFTIWTIVSAVKKLITVLFSEPEEEPVSDSNKPKNIQKQKLILYSTSTGRNKETSRCVPRLGLPLVSGVKSIFSTHKQITGWDLWDYAELWHLTSLSTKDQDAKVVLVDLDCKVPGATMSAVLNHCAEYHPNARVLFAEGYKNLGGTPLLDFVNDSWLKLFIQSARQVNWQRITWHRTNLTDILKKEFNPEFAASVQRKTTPGVRMRAA